MKKNFIVLLIVALTIAGLVAWRRGGSGETLSFNSASFDLETEEGEMGNTSIPVPAIQGRFNLDYPKSFQVRLENLEGGKKYVFESNESKKGFEIAVLPFDEVEPLTKERIWQDLPDMVIKNERNIIVGKDIKALAFESQDEYIGETYEIWFVSGGNLYEAKTYKEFGKEMQNIMGTFR